MAEIHDPLLREIGAKLANFRRKLGDAIGEKIIQAVFGEMFGDYTSRMIETYEGGKVEIPARLFFILWRHGNSIDAIFGEGGINENGRAQAKRLFDASILASLETMDELETQRVEASVREAKRDKTKQVAPTQERTLGTSGKRKRSHHKARKIKKR